MASMIKLKTRAGAVFEVVDESGEAEIQLQGVKVLGEQQANIADASEAHALSDTFDDEEVEAALDALGATINAILAVLEAHGLTADS